MNILLIGNGFDIAHKLPTTYKDFLDCLQVIINMTTYNEREHKFISEIESMTNINSYTKKYLKNLTLEIACEYSNDTNNTPDDKRLSFLASKSKNSVFTELINVINNYWYHHFTNECTSLKNGWIDFELEISNVIKRLDDIKSRNDFTYFKEYTFYTFYNKINKIIKDDNHEHNKENFELIVKFLIDDLNNLIRYFEIYLEEVVSIQEVNKLPQFENKQFDCILSFNYTDTFRRLYDSDNKLEYDFIHGKADINNTVESNNMVLGIDEFSNDEAKIQDAYFIQFKKYFQRIHKRTGGAYQKWLDDDKDKKLFIFGHSLDITDRDMLRELITFPKMKTVIYNHDKKAYGSQIANLVKVLGKDKFIKMIHGNERTILFKDFNDAGDKEETDFFKSASLLREERQIRNLFSQYS